MKIVFDTSFLQSYLNKKDSNFLNSRKLFRKLDKEFKPIVPMIVIGELLCGTGDEASVTGFTDILSEGKYETNTKSDIEFLKKLNPIIRRSLKANDCFILSICDRENAKLLTFDKKLQKAYKKVFDKNSF